MSNSVRGNTTSTYEVLEPETWVGKELPILKYIDVAEALRRDTWLVLLYHYDCPDCRRVIPQYEEMARDLSGNRYPVRIALVEIPPYGPNQAPRASCCLRGQLADVKEWFVTTPATVVLIGSKVAAAWEGETPDGKAILTTIVKGSGDSMTTPDNARPHRTFAVSQ